MHSTASLRNAGRLAIAGGAAYAVMGALQATHGDFGGTHNTIDSTAEYLVTGAFGAGLLFTGPAYAALGRLAGKPKAGLAALVPHVVLGLMSLLSVVRGEDAAFFNAVAPLALLTILVSSVVIAVALKRTAAVPKGVAYALPALIVAVILLSPIGGGLLAGAFWIVAGTRAARGDVAGRAPAPALARV